MVAWAWDAGSSNTTIAAGGLNSSVYDQSQDWAADTTVTARLTYSGHYLLGTKHLMVLHGTGVGYLYNKHLMNTTLSSATTWSSTV